MAACIVGLIVGTIALISPLIYLMLVDLYRATLIAANPEAAAGVMQPSAGPALLYGIAAVGALALVISAISMHRALPARKQPAEEAQESSSSESPEY